MSTADEGLGYSESVFIAYGWSRDKTVREFQLRNERALDRLSCVAHSENYLKVLVPLALSTGREDPSRMATHPSGGGWMASSSLVFSLSEQSKRKEGRRSQAPWPQLLHQPPLP